MLECSDTPEMRKIFKVRGRLSGRPDGAPVAGLAATQEMLSEEKEQSLVKEDLPDLPNQGDITGFSDKLENSSQRLSHSHSEATLNDDSPEVGFMIIASRILFLNQAPPEKHRPHSQIFDFDNTEFVLQSEVASKPPQMPVCFCSSIFFCFLQIMLYHVVITEASAANVVLKISANILSKIIF